MFTILSIENFHKITKIKKLLKNKEHHMDDAIFCEPTHNT